MGHVSFPKPMECKKPPPDLALAMAFYLTLGLSISCKHLAFIVKSLIAVRLIMRQPLPLVGFIRLVFNEVSTGLFLFDCFLN